MSETVRPAATSSLDEPRDLSPHSASAPGSRGVGAGRHLASALIALVAVPAGYLALDYAGTDAAYRQAQDFGEGALPARTVAVLLVAVGLFFAAALSGRLSGLGPLLAGILWGALPTLWVLVDYKSFIDRVLDLRDTIEPYDRFAIGILQYDYFVFPIVCGLLLGLAAAGRWRRPAPTARQRPDAGLD